MYESQHLKYTVIEGCQRHRSMKRKLLFRAMIEGFELMPKIRLPRFNQTRFKRGRPNRYTKYLDMKKALAWEFKKAYTSNLPLQGELSLSCSIHLKHRRKTDLDNCIGSVLDALQYAGIIDDDSQIKEFGRCVLFQDGVARVVVELRTIEQ